MINLKYLTIYRLGLLAVLVLLGVAVGTWDEITIPTLPNLKEKLNVSYEVLGRLMSMRSMGNIVSLLVTGYLYDSFPRYVPYMMVTECFVAGVCTIIIPWCRQFWLVVVLFFIQSGAQYALNNGGQLLILKTFKMQAVGKMQIYHLGYGIGTILCGIISQPFLPRQMSHQTKITKYCQKIIDKSFMGKLNGSQNLTNFTIPEIVGKSSFEYIYLIAGMLAIVISLIFLSFTFLRNPDPSSHEVKKKESWLMKIHPKYTANGKICFGIVMTILLFLYYFCYLFGLLNILSYTVVFAIDPCKKYSMSQKDAVFLHSIGNGCFLLGRIVGSFVSTFSPTIMILTFNFFNTISILILLFFSNDYVLGLWIGSCGMRFFTSVIYPTGTSYMNHYIIVTSSLISVAFLGGTVGVIAGQALGGYVLDNFPSYYVFFACLGSMITLFIITIIIVVLGKMNGIRDFSEEKKSSQNENLSLNKRQK